MQITHAISSFDTESTQPVIVLIHGWGADERDLPGLLDMIAPHAQSVSLRAPHRYGFGYTWFDEWDHEGVPTGESLISQSSAACDAILAWLDLNINRHRSIVPLGFSQGGLLATHLLRRAPQRCMAAVSCSGWFVDAPQNGDADLASKQPPVFYGHGDADMIFPQHIVNETSRFWQDHAVLEEHVYAGMGHSICIQEAHDIAAFLERIEAVRPRIF